MEMHDNSEKIQRALLVGIDTDNIDIRENKDSINIDIDYALDINYEHLANCKIKMEIKNSVSMGEGM